MQAHFKLAIAATLLTSIQCRDEEGVKLYFCCSSMPSWHGQRKLYLY